MSASSAWTDLWTPRRIFTLADLSGVNLTLADLAGFLEVHRAADSRM
jgi:hypothetical protein